jgi:hypothetical protein
LNSGLAVQELYCWSHVYSPFFSAYFWDKVSLFCQASLEWDPPIYTSWHSWDTQILLALDKGAKTNRRKNSLFNK